MARAIDVAKFLIKLAALEDEPQYLTHLQLQKLLYYVQGWSLAMRDIPMFSERIEAWANGPVVKDVYPCFASYGYKPITLDESANGDPEIICPEELEPDECELIQSVWSVYKDYSASYLWKMTHSESPWIKARGKSDPSDACNNDISMTDMKGFFCQLAEK